jgi:hypothetical protein
MNKVNNVNIESVQSFETQLKSNPSEARKTQGIEGEWKLEEGGAQFVSNLTTKVEADLNFSKVFGISEEPIMEEVRVKLTVVSDDPIEKIKQAEELTLQRCPVVFTLKNPVKLVPSLEVNNE